MTAIGMREMVFAQRNMSHTFQYCTHSGNNNGGSKSKKFRLSVKGKHQNESSAKTRIQNRNNKGSDICVRRKILERRLMSLLWLGMKF
jgi:hypothetical protein